MFFIIKRRALPALVTAVLLFVAGTSIRHACHVSGDLQWNTWQWIKVPGGLLFVLGGIGLIHLILRFTIGVEYLRRCNAFLDYFRQKSALAVLAGAVMAGCGEEVF